MKSRFQGLMTLTLLGLVLMQILLLGCAESEYLHPLSVADLFESKGKTMKEVATEVVTLPEDEDIRGLDFSPDGKLLATTSTQTLAVKIWDWRNRRIVRAFQRPQGSNLGSTESVRFSPDGRLLASCSDPSGPNRSITRIWNATSGEVVHDIEEPYSGGCEAIAFFPDGTVLARIAIRRADDIHDSLIIYDTKTWQSIWGLHLTPFYPKHLAISPDGKFVALAGQVRNPLSWPFPTPQPTFGTPPSPNQALIVVVDVERRTVMRAIQAYAERLAWSPDGAHIVAGGGLDPIMIFDAESGALVTSEKGETGHVLVRYTPDGKYLIERIDLKVLIWDGQHREVYQEIPAAPGVIAVSQDGHYLAMGGDKKVIVWKLK
jgi:WD40 repeat protein